MAQRIEGDPDPLIAVGIAHNEVAMAKSKQVGGLEHHNAMARLVEMVARTPKALDLLKGDRGRI